MSCGWVLKGYRSCLEQEGMPFVLEEGHTDLRALALNADRDPAKFWDKLTKLLADPQVRSRLNYPRSMVSPHPAARQKYFQWHPIRFVALSFPQICVGRCDRRRLRYESYWVSRDPRDPS